jgi:hypothetical protein
MDRLIGALCILAGTFGVFLIGLLAVALMTGPVWAFPVVWFVLMVAVVAKPIGRDVRRWWANRN